MSDDKTHFRKAFDSPYLSSADIVEPITLTVKKVILQIDMTKKTKDLFNTVHFVEPEIRRGEALKPMILNATNSKTMRGLAGSPFIEDWAGVRFTVYVDHAVRFGRETVEGLRISPTAPETVKKTITPENTKLWENAKTAYLRDGHLNEVLKRVDISDEHQKQIADEASAQTKDVPE